MAFAWRIADKVDINQLVHVQTRRQHQGSEKSPPGHHVRRYGEPQWGFRSPQSAGDCAFWGGRSQQPHQLARSGSTGPAGQAMIGAWVSGRQPASQTGSAPPSAVARLRA